MQALLFAEGGKCLQQLGAAVVGRVVGIALLQRLLRSLPDGQGGVELRLAQSQLHAAGGLGGKGGEPADAGKGEAGDGRIHGQTHG